jgi:hypothetical protein
MAKLHMLHKINFDGDKFSVTIDDMPNRLFARNLNSKFYGHQQANLHQIFINPRL